MWYSKIIFNDMKNFKDRGLWCSYNKQSWIRTFFLGRRGAHFSKFLNFQNSRKGSGDGKKKTPTTCKYNIVSKSTIIRGSSLTQAVVSSQDWLKLACSFKKQNKNWIRFFKFGYYLPLERDMLLHWNIHSSKLYPLTQVCFVKQLKIFLILHFFLSSPLGMWLIMHTWILFSKENLSVI